MNIKRKMIVLARHGEKPGGECSNVDAITPESFERIYRSIGTPLRGNFSQQTSFLWHSNKKRTYDTGATIIAGAFGLSLPRSRKDITSLNLTGIEVREDARLGYNHWLKFDEEAIMENPWAYLDWMLANKDSTQYGGTEVTPYIQVIENGRNVLVDALGKMLSGKKDFGVIASHGAIIEAPVIVAINSTRPTPVEKFEDIGGQFDQENVAYLKLDYNPKADRLLDARLERKGREYKVDVSKILVV